jgi:xanthosine phosphorylase
VEVYAKLAAKYIRDRLPADFHPRVALILGSGLGELVKQIEVVLKLPYGELPDFPITTVPGHAGQLVLGNIAGVPVACLQGRTHLYEGGASSHCRTMVRTMHLLGCDILLGTNASGSLRETVGPGELVVVSDHINFQGSNPLVGVNDDEMGPRFSPMSEAYDPLLRKLLRQAADHLSMPLHEGVYIGVLGPSFETPAEIRAFKIWGADVVGMSTIPEVIVARHCGMRVAVIATVTNFACGLSEEPITHELTLHYGLQMVGKLSQLISHFLTLV